MLHVVLYSSILTHRKIIPVEFLLLLNTFRILSVLKLIGPVSRVFANGLGGLCSIPGRVIPKTLKMVLDTSLLNAQYY